MYSLLKSLLVTSTFVAASSAGAACKIGHRGNADFVIPVDSIVIDNTTSSSTVSARFYGLIGGNGCRTLKRVERFVHGDTLELRFIGTERGGNCTQMLSLLNHEENRSTNPGQTIVFAAVSPTGKLITRHIDRP